MLTDKSGKSEEELQKEAESILSNMSHNIGMKSIRFMGVTLSKIMKKLYTRVQVNPDGIIKLKESLKDSYVVLLPTHRSYADFLLVSYVMFCFNLPMPVIAAAMDFMNMKFVGELLRCCGAFFIRRSFVDDDLYWSVFSHYIKTLVKISQESLEFFIEGTRSRTNKSLYPKIGMLGILLEMWLSGYKDIKIVPIGISYDRILEEKLYSWELFGVPKPKESTSGLFKVRHVLNESYGNVYFNIGDPISISDMAKQFGVKRLDHNLQLRFRPSLFESEKYFLRQLSKIIVESQQKNSIVSNWSVIVLILMNYRISHPTPLSIVTLCQHYTDLMKLLTLFEVKLGADLGTNVLTSMESILTALDVHKGLVKCEDGGVTLIGQVDVERLTKEETQLTSVIVDRIHLGIYRNPLLFHVARESLLLKRIRLGPPADTQSLFEDFRDMMELFSREFIFSGSPQHNFDTGLVKLRKTTLLVDGWTINDGHASYNIIEEALTLYLVAYFIYGHVFLRDIVHNITSMKSSDQMRVLQRCAINLCRSYPWLGCHYLEMCSLDIARNALTQMTEIFKSKSMAVLQAILHVLRNFLPVEMKVNLQTVLIAYNAEENNTGP